MITNLPGITGQEDQVTPNLTETFTCGDLFSGAGGLTVGFHHEGFNSIFFNEIDKVAAKTFSYNFPNAIPFMCPIQELTAEQIYKDTFLGNEELDVMVGGPPCQGFSINAPIRSTEDPRNILFHHYVRLVLEGIRPKFVVLENVPGLLSFNNGKTLEDVITAFERAGYNVIFRILNAAHYGVPEERWRLVFIGTRLSNIELSFPLPTHYSLQRPNFTGGRSHTFQYAIGKPLQASLIPEDNLLKPITVDEAISDLPSIESGGGSLEMDYNLPPQNEYQDLLRTRSNRLHNHICAGVSKVNLERMSHVKPGGSWRDIPHDLLPPGMQRAHRSDHTKRYGRLDPDGISGTILTKCDPHWGTVFHYNQDRIISVREAARIQSFPDWFHFIGTRSDQYRQVGNAVPPLLAKAIANHIKKLIEKHNLTTSIQNRKVADYATSTR